MDVGGRIRAHREAAGMLQEELARELYVSRQTVSNWERNRTLPDIASLKEIAAIFGTTVDALIGDDAPEISQRFDHDARELLGLYIAFWTVYLIGTAFIWGNMGAERNPSLIDLELIILSVILGAMITLAVLCDIKKRKHGLHSLEEITGYLARNAVIEDTRAARIVRFALNHTRSIYVATYSTIILLSYFGMGTLRGGVNRDIGAMLLIIFGGAIILQCILESMRKAEQRRRGRDDGKHAGCESTRRTGALTKDR